MQPNLQHKKAAWLKYVTCLGENKAGAADVGRSTSSRFTPGFYSKQHVT